MDIDQVVLEELSLLFKSRAPAVALTPDSSLRDLGFRSIDFAALALRVEDRAGRELDLSAGRLGDRIDRVEDLQTFFRAAVPA